MEMYQLKRLVENLRKLGFIFFPGIAPVQQSVLRYPVGFLCVDMGRPRFALSEFDSKTGQCFSAQLYLLKQCSSEWSKTMHTFLLNPRAIFGHRI